jgi:hypothetical protein
MPENENDTETVTVVIAFDPADPGRQGSTVALAPAEAHGLVATGRARYASDEDAQDQPAQGEGQGGPPAQDTPGNFTPAQ